jgi:hypothetical protein
LIAGSFTNVNGVTRNRVALLNPDGSVDVQFAPGTGPNQTVNGVALQRDGKILLVGDFSTVGGQARNRIARLLGDGRVDTSFNPNLVISGVLRDGTTQVHAVSLDQRGDILVAGNFTTINGLPRPGLLRLHGDAPEHSNLGGPKLAGVVFDRGQFHVSFETSAGRMYVLEYKNSLFDPKWQPSSAVEGDGAVKRLSDLPAGTDTRFYRVRTN